MDVEAVGKLRYRFCDDWFIYAEDSEGRAYYLNTELWPEWADLPPDADQEEDAIERYMLPHARPLLRQPERWERVPDGEVREWREVELEDLVIVLSRVAEHKAVQEGRR